ncbi:MAG: tripartite tricarboxylate transporter TctB family protein [Nitrososphaerota archaeon]|nr:tripartite tricarboxylate transporter TctB family protein [Nitrososphaerales archaeon]MDW8045026.1 tripartite tricarboxylate transporter TctB family protein [Nitrososphaerota archaeon]
MEGLVKRANMHKIVNALTPLFLFIIGIFITLESLKMPKPTVGMIGTILSPGFFPTILGICLMGLSMGLMVRLMRRKEPQHTSSSKGPFLTIERKRWLVINISTIIYILLLDKFYFPILTFIYLTFLFIFLRRSQSIKRLVLYALVATFFLSFVLPQLFEIPLPYS